MTSRTLSLLISSGLSLLTMTACSGSGDGASGFPGLNSRDAGPNDGNDRPETNGDSDAGPTPRSSADLDAALDRDSGPEADNGDGDHSDRPGDGDLIPNELDGGAPGLGFEGLEGDLFPSDSETDPTQPTLSPRERIESTVFRIEATGTFATPLSANNSQVAGGTGFVINENGYALTNAHVISGASLLRVTFPGESRDRNAQIVARAECSDLAVMKVDGSAGSFPYLSWSDVEADLGTDVLAVGYPLSGDITLTSGIVSKASTPAQTNWASVDDVIEHTATINPGSSGGPLLSEDYEVLGVNYAGSNLNQYYAIGKLEVERIIDDLLGGHDVYSIGLNGVAAGDDALSGIWVFSVQAGSAADRAGIEPGDLVTHFGGLPLVPDEDGNMTMEDYCDILRSHSETAAIEVRVLRWESGEIWEGQINGRGLELVAGPTAPTVPSAPTDVSPDVTVIWDDSYTDTEMIAHSADSIRAEVPETWFDKVSAAATRYDGSPGHLLIAAEDLDGFLDYPDVPGILIAAWRDTQPTPHELLDAYSASSKCGLVTGREDIDAGIYAGSWDLFAECGDGLIMQFAFEASDHVVFVEAQVLDDRDIESVVRVLDTFEVTPRNLP